MCPLSLAATLWLRETYFIQAVECTGWAPERLPVLGIKVALEVSLDSPALHQDISSALNYGDTCAYSSQSVRSPVQGNLFKLQDLIHCLTLNSEQKLLQKGLVLSEVCGGPEKPRADCIALAAACTKPQAGHVSQGKALCCSMRIWCLHEFHSKERKNVFYAQRGDAST